MKKLQQWIFAGSTGALPTMICVDCEERFEYAPTGVGVEGAVGDRSGQREQGAGAGQRGDLDGRAGGTDRA